MALDSGLDCLILKLFMSDFCEILLLLRELDVVFSKSFCYLNYLEVPHEKVLYQIKFTKQALLRLKMNKSII